VNHTSINIYSKEDLYVCDMRISLYVALPIWSHECQRAFLGLRTVQAPVVLSAGADHHSPDTPTFLEAVGTSGVLGCWQMEGGNISLPDTLCDVTLSRQMLKDNTYRRSDSLTTVCAGIM